MPSCKCFICFNFALLTGYSMHTTILRELDSIEQTLGRIGPAVSIFGSARIAPGSAVYALAYDIAERLSNLGYTVISGGGPGIMRAANEGASAGASQSIGFNIALPFETLDATYQDISLVFDNFITRKLAFAKCSHAFVVMPGGMGTLDELFEMLTLIQTRKMAKVPVILVGSQFWNGLLEWMRENLESSGLINPGELGDIELLDHADAVCASIGSRIPLIAPENARAA
ncbi:TIGR00730 family Rossman fold protein [Massilia atriviolacea]|uniref:Cytokinin riboside 5'-monophosphate phosphoribohydrolase n=2 Tax=Massilia atriviolacea TaxID=2495579 RepID=A0A430HFY9_9BURK|nr:TIGR00730 family Rossman fold protein [Massilia atriviolacea]